MLDILMRAGCYVAIIVLGYILRKKKFFPEETFGVLSKIVINIALPAAIIANTSGKPIDAAMLVIALLGMTGGLLKMLMAFLLSHRKSREEKAFMVLNVPGYNIGNFAMPFTQSFLGPMGVLATSLFDIGNAFVCLGGAYGVASVIKEGNGFSLWKILKAPLKTVPFLVYVLMAVLNLCHLTLPAPVVSLAEIIGSSNAFLAMLMIGVGFRLTGDRSQIGKIVKILGIRYSVAAVIGLSCFCLLPFALEVRQALLILAFSPIASAAPAFTAEMDGDVGLSSAVNSISIVVSIVIIVGILMVTV